MMNPGRRLLIGAPLVVVLCSAACKGDVERRQIVADANAYLTLADAGDPGAYQRLSAPARKYITEAAFMERIKVEPGAKVERRRMEVVGRWENQALVRYEVKYGTGPWEAESGFYAKESRGWMRTFARQMIGEYEEAQKNGSATEETAILRMLEIEPDPVIYLASCSLRYKRGDNPAGERACRMAIQSAEHFPTKRFRETELIAYEMLALRASDGAAAVRDASDALEFMDKNSDLSRDREGSFRFARLGTHIKRFQGKGDLSSAEWRLVEEDWGKLRALCEKGPCAGLGKRVQEVAAGMEDVLAQRRSAAPAAADSRARSLGGGYKGIKWGASQKEVIRALGMKPGESTAESLTFKYGGTSDGSAKELTCLFYKGAFFGVLFEPGLSDGDQQGANAIQQALVEKYGKPRELSGLVDGLMGIALIAFEWDDGETRIRSTMMDPEKLEEGLRSVGGGRGRLGYPSSTLKVAYSSIVLSDQKKQEESQSKARAEKEEQQRKRAKFAGDL